MNYAALGLSLIPIPGAVPVRRAVVTAEQWLTAAKTMRQAGGLLLALWASDERDRHAGFVVRAAVQDDEGLVVLQLKLPGQEPEYPSLASIFPAAERMQRAANDLFGVKAKGGDARPWLRHAAWPAESHPLRKDYGIHQSWPAKQESYHFVRVTGEGVHEIPVGPVHAGIIEPGHFRFSVVGEKVLRLEERLGYVHKGIEKRFETMSVTEGHRLAARVSGDSAVAFSWAYCMALEGLCGVTPPPRALYLRALYLECERIANHLGDLGALGNDAGFAFGLAQFSRLKEDWLRTNAQAFTQRYLLDAVIPGGVASDLDEPCCKMLLARIPVLESQVQMLREIYDNHAGVQDRFIACGRVAPDLAANLGLIGLAGRASGQCWDLRCDHPYAPYDQFDVRMVSHRNGDVAARVTVRFEEVLESLRLCRFILDGLPAGEILTPVPAASTDRLGVGWVEGWRGPVLVALEADGLGKVRRCHPHDPSWQNWPVLEHAVIGNIVPDFPLINKSFNLSYSGQDL